MIAVFVGVLMKDDFGYFGSGLEGYVQYNEAFKRNFDSASTPDSIIKDNISDMEPENEDSVEDETDMDFTEDDSSESDEF